MTADTDKILDSIRVAEARLTGHDGALALVSHPVAFLLPDGRPATTFLTWNWRLAPTTVTYGLEAFCCPDDENDGSFAALADVEPDLQAKLAALLPELLKLVYQRQQPETD